MAPSRCAARATPGNRRLQALTCARTRMRALFPLLPYTRACAKPRMRTGPTPFAHVLAKGRPSGPASLLSLPSFGSGPDSLSLSQLRPSARRLTSQTSPLLSFHPSRVRQPQCSADRPPASHACSTQEGAAPCEPLSATPFPPLAALASAPLPLSASCPPPSLVRSRVFKSRALGCEVTFGFGSSRC